MIYLLIESLETLLSIVMIGSPKKIIRDTPVKECHSVPFGLGKYVRARKSNKITRVNNNEQRATQQAVSQTNGVGG